MTQVTVFETFDDLGDTWTVTGDVAALGGELQLVRDGPYAVAQADRAPVDGSHVGLAGPLLTFRIELPDYPPGAVGTVTVGLQESGEPDTLRQLLIGFWHGTSSWGGHTFNPAGSVVLFAADHTGLLEVSANDIDPAYTWYRLRQDTADLFTVERSMNGTAWSALPGGVDATTSTWVSTEIGPLIVASAAESMSAPVQVNVGDFSWTYNDPSPPSSAAPNLSAAPGPGAISFY